VAFVAPFIKAGFAEQFTGDDEVLRAPAGDELLFLSDGYSFAHRSARPAITTRRRCRR
jgi:hypothetical protein